MEPKKKFNLSYFLGYLFGTAVLLSATLIVLAVAFKLILYILHL